MTIYFFPLCFLWNEIYFQCTFVCAKKPQKSNKSSQKATKMCTFPSFYYYTSNFLSLEISNFGPFLSFSFLLTALHNDYKRIEDTGKMAYSCSTKLQSFHDLSSADVVVFSSRCRAREISLDAVISQSSRAGEHVFMYVCFAVFFFFFPGGVLISHQFLLRLLLVWQTRCLLLHSQFSFLAFSRDYQQALRDLYLQSEWLFLLLDVEP